MDIQIISYINQWYEWNVTSFVKNELSEGKVTFLLDSPTDLGYVSFHSKEMKNNPELNINLK